MEAVCGAAACYFGCLIAINGVFLKHAAVVAPHRAGTQHCTHSNGKVCARFSSMNTNQWVPGPSRPRCPLSPSWPRLSPYMYLF